MPDPTIIPASREEIAAHLMTGAPEEYSSAEDYTSELEANRQWLERHRQSAQHWFQRVGMVESWLSAAREQGRSEGAKAPIDARLEPDRFAQVAYLPDGTKISICRSPQGGAWIEHGPQARIGISDGPAEARKAQGRDGA